MNADEEKVLSLIEEVSKNPEEAIKKHPKFFECPELVISAIAGNPDVSNVITFEIALTLIKKDGWFFPFLPARLRSNHELILEALKTTDYELMDDVDPQIFEDVEFMRKATKINGAVYCYSTGNAATDKEVILNALKSGGDFSKYVKMKAREQAKDPEIAAAMTMNKEKTAKRVSRRNI